MGDIPVEEQVEGDQGEGGVGEEGWEEWMIENKVDGEHVFYLLFDIKVFQPFMIICSSISKAWRGGLTF